jgi:hypothetical protein
VAALTVRLSEPELAAALSAYLTRHGFLVSRRGRAELELALLNPVSVRYDRARAESAVREWVARNAERLKGSALELI